MLNRLRPFNQEIPIYIPTNAKFASYRGHPLRIRRYGDILLQTRAAINKGYLNTLDLQVHILYFYDIEN